MKRFNPTSTQPVRAIQAWQILVAAAMNRQTITYKKLSVLMYGREAAGVLDRILGHIAYYCIENTLPALTVIVVGTKTGTPGPEIPVDPGDWDTERERVYKANWYDVCPPAAEEFAECFAKHSKKRRE